MSIKSLLNSLSTALRANNNKSLFNLLSQTEFSGLHPNSSGMTLENMINAISAYLERYNLILRHKLHSSNQDNTTVLNTDIGFDMIANTNGPVGFFAFEDRITSLTCNELDRVPPFFCYGSSSISSIDFPKAEIVYEGAFVGMNRLTSVNLPLLHTCSLSKISNIMVPSQFGEDRGIFACSGIKEISLPNLKWSTASELFYGCTYLTTVDLPLYTGYSSTANEGYSSGTFWKCGNLINVNIPSLKRIGIYDFYECRKLEKLEIPSVTFIGGNAFGYCDALTALIINRPTPPTLDNINAFSNTPIQKGTGYIYVPDSAVNTYKTATNWSSFANQIKPISEYTEV